MKKKIIFIMHQTLSHINATLSLARLEGKIFTDFINTIRPDLIILDAPYVNYFLELSKHNISLFIAHTMYTHPKVPLLSNQ